MTVYEFLYYCIDPGMLTVKVWSNAQGQTVWSGPGDEVPDDICDAELGSFDVPYEMDTITINID